MTSDGSLYGFGRNQNGQLGLGNSNDAVQPVLVQSLQVHISLPNLLIPLLQCQFCHTQFFFVGMPYVSTCLASTLCCCQVIIAQEVHPYLGCIQACCSCVCPSLQIAQKDPACSITCGSESRSLMLFPTIAMRPSQCSTRGTNGLSHSTAG